ncbi:MAG: CHC2 zinc finger domain-containing protein [Crocinitomicaceae bacterium]
MAKIPAHIVDEILQTALIEEVVADFISLKRAGANLKGLSPFTDEKKPSFVVSPSKQIFKCFKTGKGGKVVTFLMEKEQMSYPEALRWLADKYNIIIPEEETVSQAVQNAPKAKQNDLIKVANGVYTEYYPGGTRIKLKGLLDDKKNRQGVWDYYAENGVHLSMMEYRDGLKHGVFFQRYKTGIIKRTGNYKNDKQIGEWVEYNENGIRSDIKEFTD